MENENLDVKADPSTANNDVNEDPSTSNNVDPNSADVGGKQHVEEIDEIGVPYKNRYMESQRKLQALEEKVDRLANVPQNTPQKQEYTLEELEAFRDSTEDEYNRQWANKQIKELQVKNIDKLVQEKVNNYVQNEQVAKTKAQAFNDVVNRNPNIVARDPSGRIIGYNLKDPLCARMNQYLSNPEIANRPDALLVAEAFAAKDLYYQSKNKSVSETELARAEAAELKKKTLPTGAGVSSNFSSTPDVYDRFKRTGHINDATSIMKERLKKKGVIE